MRNIFISSIVPPLFYMFMCTGSIRGESEQPIQDAITQKKIEHLTAIKEHMDFLREQIAGSHDRREKMELRIQLEKNRDRFISKAADLDIDSDKIALTEDEKKDIIKEVQTIMEPLIDQFKRISERPRKIEKLRKTISELQIRITALAGASERLEQLINNSMASPLQKNLQESKMYINERREELQTRLDSAKRALSDETKNDKTMVQAITEGLHSFFSTKGKNLGISIAVALIILWLALLVKKRLLGSKRLGTRLAGFKKIVNALYGFIVASVAVGGFVASLYFLNDWVLFTISLLIIMAFIWSSKQVLPRFFTELRIMLNLGTVKEGERIIINDIPWFVKSVGMNCVLVNKELEAGCIKIPARELCALRSRPITCDEPWFPCKKDEWVMLGDGTYGKILLQTPEQVIMELQDKTRKYYNTAEFIKSAPQNFSGGFLLTTELGLAYNLQKSICKEVPDALVNGLSKRFTARIKAGELNNFFAEFKSADASALTILARVECSGSMAGLKTKLLRELNTALVDICNENGYSIPFNQLDVRIIDQK